MWAQGLQPTPTPAPTPGPLVTPGGGSLGGPSDLGLELLEDEAMEEPFDSAWDHAGVECSGVGGGGAGGAPWTCSSPAPYPCTQHCRVVT